MPQLMDLMSQVLGGGATSQISRQLGADESTTGNGIAACLPMLLSGLSRNVAQPGGADALHAALTRDHDGTALDDVAGAVTAPAGNGAGILRHVLGDRQDAATQAVANASGLGTNQAGMLLTMLAPLVMGAIGRQQRSLGLDASGVAGLLQNEHQQVSAQQPDLMGLANRLLDRDHDGSALNDVTGMLGKLMGGR